MPTIEGSTAARIARRFHAPVEELLPPDQAAALRRLLESMQAGTPSASPAAPRGAQKRIGRGAKAFMIGLALATGAGMGIAAGRDVDAKLRGDFSGSIGMSLAFTTAATLAMGAFATVHGGTRTLIGGTAAALGAYAVAGAGTALL